MDPIFSPAKIAATARAGARVARSRLGIALARDRLGCWASRSRAGARLSRWMQGMHCTISRAIPGCSPRG